MDVVRNSGFMTNAALPAGEGHVREILGTRQIWKTRASQTDGTLVCVEIVVPPGLGIPPHRHTHEDETFYVLAGTIDFGVDDCAGGAIALGPGGLFYGPRGRLHMFRNDGPEVARVLSVVTPGGPTDALFGELEETALRQERPVDAAQVIAACARYGIAFGEP